MGKKLKLYHIKRSTLITTIIIFSLCVVCIYLTSQLDYVINSVSIDGVKNDELNKLITYRTISDVMVVITSILGTNLLLSVLVEKRSKNNLVTEFLVNEMLASESVYFNLSDENQKTILDNIELRRVFENNKIAYNMHKYMIDKVKNDLKNYYFAECEYVVVVDAKDEYFEKVLTHTIELKTYEPNTTIKEFSLAKINMKSIEGMPNFEIKDVQIDGVPVKIEPDGNGKFTKNSEVQLKVVPNGNKLDNKNGYDTTVQYYLKKKLHCKNDESIKIVSNFITRCPMDDIVTTFRASVPCKKFSVNYTINQEQNYKLGGSAFGFLDASTAFQNSHKPNIMRFGFNNWIFTDDGVSITIIKK